MNLASAALLLRNLHMIFFKCGEIRLDQSQDSLGKLHSFQAFLPLISETIITHFCGNLKTFGGPHKKEPMVKKTGLHLDTRGILSLTF